MINFKSSSTNSGFTLIEILVAVVILGILSMLLSPVFGSLITSQKGSYYEKQKLNDRLIADSLMNYARESGNGVLPTPYTGSGRTNAIYDPASSTAAGLALIDSLNRNGLNPNEINDDGYASQRVRVYQLVTGLTQTLPLYFQSGPQVTLTYQYGVVYQTNCPKASAGCNPNSVTTVPGDSSKMTSSNYTNWTISGSDLAPQFISSLPIQKQKLYTTTQRMDKLRDAFVSFLVTQQRTAAANDPTNWYPTGSTSLGGASPATNQGCRDGWYNLSTATTILPTIGLSSAEYGVTSWGGAIEYCRDYDANGTKVANAPPHYAAIRVRKTLSSGTAPDSSVPSNNIVLTF